MKRSLLDFLVCPVCGCSVELKPFVAQNDWIEEGVLTCAKGDRFPIVRGIPVLIEPGLRRKILGHEETAFWQRHAAMETTRTTNPADGGKEHAEDKQSAANVWGYQWQDFHELWQDEAGEDQFYRWLAPLRPEDLRGKVILDGGCGTGRHVLYSSRHARTVIGIDLSLATRVASRITRDIPHAHVVQADIYHLPFRDDTFDRAYSIGVIHHLPEPRRAFLGLRPKVKPGGTLTVWLYGRENNWLAACAVEAVRARVTSRLPLPLLKFLSFFPALTLWLIIRLFYAPMNFILPRMAERMPYNRYFMLFDRLSFRHQWMNVFDKLNAPIANYYRREEMEDWLRESQLADTCLSHTNDISWSLHGTRR